MPKYRSSVPSYRRQDVHYYQHGRPIGSRFMDSAGRGVGTFSRRVANAVVPPDYRAIPPSSKPRIGAEDFMLMGLVFFVGRHLIEHVFGKPDGVDGTKDHPRKGPKFVRQTFHNAPTSSQFDCIKDCVKRGEYLDALHLVWLNTAPVAARTVGWKIARMVGIKRGAQVAAMKGATKVVTKSGVKTIVQGASRGIAGATGIGLISGGIMAAGSYAMGDKEEAKDGLISTGIGTGVGAVAHFLLRRWWLTAVVDIGACSLYYYWKSTSAKSNGLVPEVDPATNQPKKDPVTGNVVVTPTKVTYNAKKDLVKMCSYYKIACMKAERPSQITWSGNKVAIVDKSYNYNLGYLCKGNKLLANIYKQNKYDYALCSNYLMKTKVTYSWWAKVKKGMETAEEKLDKKFVGLRKLTLSYGSYVAMLRAHWGSEWESWK